MVFRPKETTSKHPIVTNR